MERPSEKEDNTDTYISDHGAGAGEGSLERTWEMITNKDFSHDKLDCITVWIF